MRHFRLIESRPSCGAPDFLPAAVGICNADAAGDEGGSYCGLDGGVGVAVGIGGDGEAGVPADEVREVAVGVVGGIEVEFPFLDLVEVADVEACVEVGEGGCQGCEELIVSLVEDLS